MLDPGGAAVGPEALPAGLADAQGRFDDAVNDFSALLATRCCPPGFLSTASRSLFACSIAFKGVILDADGSTLVDLFEDFDIPPKTVNFALNVDTTNVQATCAEVLRHVEDNLLGYTDGGLTFEECRRQSTDANGVYRRFIAAGEGHGFSQGTVDTFRTYVFPAEFQRDCEHLGQPLCAKQEARNFDRGTDLHTQSNPLPMCHRPGGW